MDDVALLIEYLFLQVEDCACGLLLIYVLALRPLINVYGSQMDALGFLMDVQGGNDTWLELAGGEGPGCNQGACEDEGAVEGFVGDEDGGYQEGSDEAQN